MFRRSLIPCTLVFSVLVPPIAASASTISPPPKTGEELVALMRERYAGRWYKTLTFVQKTTFPDGRIETWYEALELPGKLRIDIAPLDSGKTLLFRNDSLYVFEQKKLKASQPLVHPLDLAFRLAEAHGIVLLSAGYDAHVDPEEHGPNLLPNGAYG